MAYNKMAMREMNQSQMNQKSRKSMMREQMSKFIAKADAKPDALEKRQLETQLYPDRFEVAFKRKKASRKGV